jgi:hypothetical protein
LRRAALCSLLLCACSSGWRELRSEHFDLYTDLDPATARVAVEQLETFHAALRRSTGIEPKGSVEVIVFREWNDYASHAPRVSGAFFTPFGTLHSQRPTLVSTGKDFGERTAARAALLHELAHFFWMWAAPGLPEWLNEGLAEYAMGMRVDAAQGRLVDGLLDAETGDISKGSELKLDDLWRWPSHSWATHETFTERYADAWHWVHFLKFKHAEPFARFITDVRALKDAHEAFDADFPEDVRKGIDVEQRSYVRGEQFPFQSWRFTAPEVSCETRVLPDSEARMIRAALSLRQGNGLMAKMDMAFDGSADSALVSELVLGELKPEQLELLTQRRPELELPWLLLARRAFEQKDEATLRGLVARAPRTWEIPARLGNLIVLKSPSEALGLADGAAALAPWNPGLPALQAAAHAGLGELDQAITLQRRAIALAKLAPTRNPKGEAALEADLEKYLRTAP